MRVSEILSQKQINVIGIMSGTSVDGLDFVLTRVFRQGQNLSIEYVDMESVPFPKKWRERIFMAARHELNVSALAELHFLLGRFYAQELTKAVLRKSWKFDLIGLHGQTVYHRGGVASLQIGEPSFLSAQCKRPVVANFRVGDIAVGGQGAPLAPIFHITAFARIPGLVSVHNLGGISNITLFRDRQMEDAFDTGPANMPIDTAVRILTEGQRRYDLEGRMAARGQVIESLVQEMMRHPYFKKKPPKSCGREQFGEAWVQYLLDRHPRDEMRDLVTSITEGVARSIAHAYRDHVKGVPKEIILCGGGTQNLHLRSRIQSLMPSSKVIVSEEKGWPSQAIEGAAFALLAAARVWEIPLDLSRATGAGKEVVLGQITDLL